MTLIKICGITNASDAEAAVASGATALGFNFWPASKRYITPEAASEIGAGAEGNVLRVGVFVDSTPTEIGMTAARARLDVVQLHGGRGSKIWGRQWVALAADTPDLRQQVESGEAEAYLIDTPSGTERGGTGRVFEWSVVEGLKGRIILAGGLGPDNVGEAVRRVRPWGVDACSRLESSPGRKDHAKVEEFIRAVRSAEI